MKVVKFTCGDLYYTIAAKTLEEAKKHLTEDVGEQYDSYEEIPESEWDEETINIWEDNNLETEPFKISIRDAIYENDVAHIIFTNDFSTF